MTARLGSDYFQRLLMQSLTLLVLLAIVPAAAAQSDPPSRVGRVSDAAGSVFLAPDETDNSWEPIGINYPVTSGDSLWVGKDGRAEVDFGTGQIRLSDEANVHFSQLDDRQFAAYLASGQAILRLRALEPGESAKFDTANAQIDILRPGNYRIESTPDGLYTRLVVRDGEAQLRAGDRTTMVLSGQTAVVDGNGSMASLAVRDGYGTDGFDAWSADRDRRWDSGSLSSRYVSSYVPGVNDLDDYGTWESTSTYGAVWYPRAVAVDWVPYRDGRWTFVRPWGWTWVDSAPWGWAPFHYGRWVRTGYRWGWCPGTFVSHPIYAPALVAWYGGPSGNTWSMSFGGPTFGWVPLAWGEPYWPHYRHGTDYWRLINRPYAVNVYRVPSKPLPAFNYSNARIPGAVTAVSGEVFTGRRPIGANHYAVPATALAGAANTTTPLAVRPLTKPLALDNLPRGIPAPASSLAARSGVVRPADPRTPGAVGGAPFTGRPGGGITGNLSEPAPGSSRPVSPPAFVGRPSVAEPAPATARLPAAAPPSVGRPSVGEPASAPPRPVIRESGPIVNDSRQSGGQSFAPPPARSMPGARQSINEPTPQNLAPPSRPSAPVVREPARVLPQYNPGFSPGQNFAPAPRPAAPIVREPAPMVVVPPRAAQAPGPARQGVIQAAPVARPVEPQGATAPTPAPVQRSPGPMSGGPNDGPPPRMRMQSEGAQR